MALQLDPITAPLPSNRVGDVVFDRILDAIHHGQLVPGERLSDHELARQLGVSRTPVRESLLRLQVMGVVEMAAARYTRVAVVERRQTIEARAVWATLYRLVVSEVFPTASDDLIDRLRMVADRYSDLSTRATIEPRLNNDAVIANADFYNEPVVDSDNMMLKQALEPVVHVFRLGGPSLPRRPTPDQIQASHRGMLAAAEARDVTAGHRVLEQIQALDL